MINVVGGWVGGRFPDPEVNPHLFARIEGFSGPVLSINGEDDRYCSITHSTGCVAAMAAHGPDSRMRIVIVPGAGFGHWLMALPPLWQADVDALLDEIVP